MKIFIFLSVSFLSSSICFRNLEKIKVRDETVTEIISAGKNANAFYENCLVRLNPNRLGPLMSSIFLGHLIAWID